MTELRLPLPIARLHRRSQNAKSAMEEHHTAFHAWEVSLKLAVVLHHPDALRQLARASLGDWLRAFELGDRPLSSPALLELDTWLSDERDPQERKLLARALFANLVAYRNRVIGHGSTREMEFYARGAILLREGLSAAWEAELFARAGSELLYVGAVVGGEQRGAPVELLRLQGEEIEAVDLRGETTPADLWAHHPYARHAASWSDLHPWLLFDEEREQLYCFNKFARRAQYLDYASGLFLEGAPLEELRPGLEGELRELFRGVAAAPAEPEAPRPAEGRTSFGDFELERLLGQGAMGEVHLAQQRSLGRRVALKLLSTSLERDQVALARFRREVEALSRCEHPNVVKILAHGTTQGRPWYAMEYVEGADLVAVGEQLAETGDFAAAVAQACRPGAEPQVAYPRRNRFPELACFFAEAARGVQHLHDRGIVHRDLKPSNVMVTAHGHRAVVMDLGLAVVENRSLALTRDGARPLGTLRYMPPEQLERRRADLTPRADVYALGATLYELTTGHAFRDGESEEALLHQILHVDPRPARELARDLPVDLELILRKATEREVFLRYESAAAFASDLEAFAEGRAVSARPPSFVYLLRVAVRRHKELAVGVLLGLTALFVGAIVYVLDMQVAEASIRAQNEQIREAKERADGERDRAQQNLRDLFDLAEIERLDNLEREANTSLWPARSEKLPAIRDWLRRAEELRAKRASFEQKLVALEAEALAWTEEEQRRDRETHPRRGELSELEKKLEQARTGDETQRAEVPNLELEFRELAEQVATRRTWRFGDDIEGGVGAQEKFWRHRHLRTLVQRLRSFFDGPSVPGGTLGIWGPSVAEVGRRIPLIEEWKRMSLDDPAAQQAWQEAIAYAAIPKPEGKYDFDLKSIEGLVPLGVDPRSKLLEFWHVPTGERPEPNAKWYWKGEESPMGQPVSEPNRWRLKPETGVVLVLIPGGLYRFGTQRLDEKAPRFHREANDNESVYELELKPYLISKYELSQSQWMRWQGSNPSKYQWEPLQPVEHVNWRDASQYLSRVGLRLPSEAQWEAAACAGSGDAWWTGGTPELLEGAANLADVTLRNAGGYGEIVSWDDGHSAHAPIGSFLANTFGLHDTAGNVWEWCQDEWFFDTNSAEAPLPRWGDGLRVTAPRGTDPWDAYAQAVSLDEPQGDSMRVNRGGAWNTTAQYCRSSHRNASMVGSRGEDLGFRPALAARFDQ